MIDFDHYVDQHWLVKRERGEAFSASQTIEYSQAKPTSRPVRAGSSRGKSALLGWLREGSRSRRRFARYLD